MIWTTAHDVLPWNFLDHTLNASLVSQGSYGRCTAVSGRAASSGITLEDGALGLISSSYGKMRKGEQFVDEELRVWACGGSLSIGLLNAAPLLYRGRRKFPLTTPDSG